MPFPASRFHYVVEELAGGKVLGPLRREVVLSVWVAPLRGQLPAVGWRMETRMCRVW